MQGACQASLEALELQLQSFTIKQIGSAASGDPLAAAIGQGAAGGTLGKGASGGLAGLSDKEMQLVLGGLGATSGRRAAALAAMMGGGAGGGERGGGGGDRGSKQVRLLNVQVHTVPSCWFRVVRP